LTDTLVDVTSGDTILSPKAIQAFDRDAVNDAIEKWSSYAVGLGDETLEDKARLSIAHKSIAELNLTVALFDQVLGEEDRSSDIEALESQLYGHYNPDLYFAALKQKIDALMAVDLTDPDLKQARAVLVDDLETLYEDSPENIKTLEKPTQETLDQVGAWLRAEHPEIRDNIEASGIEEFDASQVKNMFDLAISLDPNLKKTGWITKVVERQKNAISTFTSLREIHVSSQKIVKHREMAGKTVHEPLGHALRSANAEVAGNEIGTHGTATYGSFEESLMMALEQCERGEYDPNKGLDGYLATGLVITSHKSPDKVAQLIGSMKQIMEMKESPTGLTPKVVARQAELTRSSIGRLFAGMTDVDLGIAHRKEINYLHGLDSVWPLLNHLVATGTLNEGMNWIMSAKFNPYSAEDRELNERYHKMPASLEQFFANK
jgi:hypothetical protein